MKLNDQKLKLIYFLVGLNLLPHVMTVPSWVITAALFFLLWRLMHNYRSWPLPRVGFLRGLVVLGAVGVVFQYGTIMGQEPATALLVLMASAKLFELRKIRDAVLLIFLCYLLLMAKLIDSQSMEMTLFMVVDVLLITAMLATLHSATVDGQIRLLLRRSLMLAVQSVPLALALFFVFPRFSLSLWRQTGKSVGETGFSESLRPGEVAKLAQSEKVAFRVSFPSRQPDSIRNLYWRGLVLNQSRGLNWDRGIRSLPLPNSDVQLKGNEIAQDIFFEPSNDSYLFALDWPKLVSFPGDPTNRLVRGFSSRVFESKLNLGSRQYYRAYSDGDQAAIEWDTPNSQVDISVTEGVTDKVRDLAASFRRKSHGHNSDLVDLITNYFVVNKFRYSLQPGIMKDLDDFLFEKKVGFCEHFAGALGTLLRLAGVPSRVVIGFQGGTPSLLKDYYLVRFLDAHAWVEFWDNSRNTWVRTDPIAVISPQRIQMGAAAFRDLLAEERGMDGKAGLPQWLTGGLGEVGERIRLIWDQSESLWVNFLLRYDWSFQRDILKKLGMEGNSRWLFVAAAVLLSLAALIFAWIAVRLTQDRLDPDLQLYRLLCLQLARAGLERQSMEGPLTFWGRAKVQFPAAQKNLDYIFSSLVGSRYGNFPTNGKMQRDLRRLIKHLRLRGNPHYSSRLSPPNI